MIALFAQLFGFEQLEAEQSISPCSTQLSTRLEALRIEGQHNEAPETFKMLSDSCNECHATYR